MLNLILLFLALDSSVSFRDSGVHHPIERDEMAVTPSGHVFILDQVSMRITHYSPEGEKIADFGGQGQGPGEFISSVRIDFWAGQLLVFDVSIATVHVFDESGRYLKSHHTDRSVGLFRTRAGWIRMALSNLPGETSTFFAFNPSLNKRSVAWSWVPKRTAPQIFGDDTMKTIGMQPAIEGARLQIGSKRRFLYLAHMGTAFKITVIDSLMEEPVRHIQKPIQPTPYDRSWSPSEKVFPRAF